MSECATYYKIFVSANFRTIDHNACKISFHMFTFGTHNVCSTLVHAQRHGQLPGHAQLLIFSHQ